MAASNAEPTVRGRFWWWACVIAAAASLGAAPLFIDQAVQLDCSIIFILALLALSMGFLWGYGGMLSFGQTAFFGLGGYAYAVLSLNYGAPDLQFLLALFVPCALALVLGYLMIYGRISDIYLSVITLAVTLILEKGIRSTSGPEYMIGSVRLNGQNGIPSLPALQLPWDTSTDLAIDGVFYLSGAALIVVYVGLRLLLETPFGRILVGVRENERRMLLIGFNSARYKLAAFVLSAAIAGLAGALYAVWGNFVAPEMFNLDQAAQVVIWVIVGGRGTLVGPIAGTALIQVLTKWLGSQGVGQVTLVLGAILMVFVLVFRRGLLPTLGDAIGVLLRLRNAGMRRPQPVARSAAGPLQ